jgi:hypothetical protein
MDFHFPMEYKFGRQTASENETEFASETKFEIHSRS